ncbi:uncharacterized protein SCHCODRAFT_02273316 [Schizophyllum commune H4-8]|uniref:uncharacterized protein n=1 Tax=Schizophyllum commune (strain H4-8 / FGSC 9210) TaxID=578458 RepID=UPI00215FD9AC|nr:uncharacterized protein SCHCODRAFT_02273316 [Schizophyllum commune H4-8]KAI5894293.1 hypothetical protein SCHCODRAFT_02273316 [Schizophyllum commune H4-8]
MFCGRKLLNSADAWKGVEASDGVCGHAGQGRSPSSLSLFLRLFVRRSGCWLVGWFWRLTLAIVLCSCFLRAT